MVALNQNEPMGWNCLVQSQRLQGKREAAEMNITKTQIEKSNMDAGES